jgi:hypothetical protein
MPGYAQNDNKSKKHHNIKIGVEFGVDGLFGDAIKQDMIRENQSSHYWHDDNDYYYGLLYNDQEMDITYWGIKPEMFFAKNRIGLSTGLRLSRYSSSIDSYRNYFLWMIHQDETYTEYVKIRDIKQNSYFLGIPVELKFFPNKRELPVQFYLKTGAVFNYRIHTNNKVKFENQSMRIHSGKINNYTKQYINDFNSYMFLGLGFKIGRHHTDNKRYIPHVNIELHALNIMLTEKASSFMKAYAGFGLQLSAQIPLGKTVPIGSRN